MNSSPTARPSRRYLHGMDWFARAMDCRTRQRTGIGSYSQVILALSGRLDGDTLRSRVSALLRRNPALLGACRRNPLNLAPYWDCPRTPSAEAPVEEWPVLPVAGEGPPPALVDAVNRPLTGRARIGFTLAHDPSRSYVAMRFDHQILDAGGAERLLEHLSEGDDADPPLSWGECGSRLNGWRGKFKSGQVANRALLALRQGGAPVAFPLPGVRPPISSRFEFRALTLEESRAVSGRADREAGYLMLLPFLLAESVRAFDAAARRAGLPSGPCVVPVTMDSRRPRQTWGVLFNHYSFHFYRFDTATPEARALLCRQAVAQLMEQTRTRLADHLSNAGDLMRILPAPLLGRLMEMPLSGRLGSFSFALLGEGYRPDSFLGASVEQVFHMPRVPAPPGLGLYFTRYRGRLTLVVSRLEGMLEDGGAAALADDLIASLRKPDGKGAAS